MHESLPAYLSLIGALTVLHTGLPSENAVRAIILKGD